MKIIIIKINMKRLTISLVLAVLSFNVLASEQRIVSAGGSVTELAFALEADKDIIAVDVSSMYPQKALQLPKIGYYRQLSAEGVLSLQPTTLIAAKGAGPKVVLQQLESAGVEVQLFEQNEYTLEAWKKLVTDIGRFFNKTAKAEALVSSSLRAIEQTKQNRQYADNSLNAVLLMSAGQRGMMVAGQKTMPDLLFQLSGLNNIAADMESYKTITNEGLISAGLDIIIIPQHTLESTGGKDTVCNNPAIKIATKGECHLLVMDSLLILGMGSRIEQAVEQLTDYANTVETEKGKRAEQVTQASK